MSIRTRLGAALALLALFAAACGDDPSPPGGQKPVEVPEILSFTATPDRLVGEGAVRLSWTTRGADSVRLLAAGEPIDLATAEPAEGNAEVTITRTTRFELIASRGTEEASETIEVEVEAGPRPDAPRIGAFTALPDVVGADPEGRASVSVTWSEVAGAESLRLDFEGRPVTLPPGSLEAGSVDVEIDGDGAFTLTASNAGGNTTATASVRLVAAPVIRSLTAPVFVGPGLPFAVSWEAEGAATVSLEQDGVPVGIDGRLTTGSWETSLLVDSAFELIAFNEVGGSVRRKVEVLVIAPAVISFTASPGHAWPGETIELKWVTEGGARVSISAAAGGVYQTTDEAEVTSGTFTILPEGTGVFEYVLEVRNGTLWETATASVRVAPGPRIVSFSVSPPKLLAGGEVEVSWEVSPDPAGIEPELSLGGDRIGAIPIESALTGIVRVALDELGDHVITLAASTGTPGSEPATEQRTATTYGAPTATLEASTEVLDYSLEPHLTLSWTTTHAEMVTISQVDSRGDTMTPPLMVVPSHERAAGSTFFEPQVDTRYRITATNGIGMAATADVSVSVPTTQILTFVATPPAVIAGDPVELSWTTRGTRWTGVDFMPRYVREAGVEPYFDISAIGTQMQFPDCRNPDDDGCEVVNFPAGFVFPFGGADQNRIKVYASGVAGFPVGHGYPSNLNVSLPSTGHTWANLAPFWDDLTVAPASRAWWMLFNGGARGSHVVIQWSHMSFRGSGGDVSFQLVLFEDGDFDFRYDVMSAPDQARADGASATIGYQFTDGATGGLVHFGSGANPFTGGLSGIAWTFTRPPSLGANDSISWTPAGSATTGSAVRPVTLHAVGVGEDDRTLSVTVHSRSVVTAIGPTAEPVIGDTFRIGWTTSWASSVAVLAEDGSTICAPGASQVAAGACDWSEQTPGDRTYVVRATGALGHTVDAEVQVRVHPPLVLAEFTADPVAIDLGQSVTLSWITSGATSMSLSANGAGVPLGSRSVDDDSITLSPTVTTNYTLEIRAGGRVERRTLEVVVRTLHLTVDADETDVHPGTAVTISWTTQTLGSGTPVVQAMVPMTESQTAYEDISLTGTLLIAPQIAINAWATVDLGSLGLRFPYFGAEYDTLRIGSQGAVGFDTSLSTWEFQNKPLPVVAGEPAKLALLPYWSDLRVPFPSATGGVYGQYVTVPGGVDYYVVQYNHQQLMSASGSELDFQVVLFADGAFEYRYGKMLPANDVLARGGRATIGYQAPGAGFGSTLHYGGPTTGGTPAAFPGGLANRSWRFEPVAANGSFVLHPASDTDFYVCAMLDGYADCKSVTVRAAFEITSFTASPSVVTSADPVVLTWSTRGADSWALYANDELLGDEGTLGASDTFVHHPEETTDYMLKIASLGRVLTQTRRVGVQLFELEVTGPAGPVKPGDPATISWTVSPPTATPTMIAPMEEVNTVSTAFTDITGSPGVVTLVGANATNAIADLNFQGAFRFPYMGVERAKVRVAQNGYLSFDSSAPGTLSSNDVLPNAVGDKAKVHLAPFWDQISTLTNGRVIAAPLGTDRYVIQWTGVSAIGGTATSAYNLNFQVVLHADGSFEYRYGTMTPPPMTSRFCQPNTCANEAKGSTATIGYQDPTGTAGFQLHFGGANPGANNPTVIGGLANRTWKYTAIQGSGQVTVHPTDSRNYQVCAVRGLALVCRTVGVEAPWRITSFDADAYDVPPNTPVTLSWETIGADVVTLKANGISIPLSSAEYASGTAVHTPVVRTTYELELGSLGRTIQATRIVEFRTVELQVNASAEEALPGDWITFDWDSTPLAGGAPTITLSMVETAEPFEDISSSGTQIPAVNNQNGGTATIAFTGGFTFPFYGVGYSSVRVAGNGYLSFDLAEVSLRWNGAIPANMHKARNLAVFWGDLHSRAPGRVHWKQGADASGRYVIVQWSHYSIDPTSISAPHDLNFQVVLHEDGRFEYRYGTMSAPNDQVGATGGKASIGYQDPTGTMGSQLSFNTPLAGGLANRSFTRYAPSEDGSISVPVENSTDFQVCAQGGAYRMCKTVSVFVPGAGDVLITELMLSPGAGSQWFELRNVQTRPIDLQGWTLSSDGGDHVIADPLVVPPFGHVVLAAGANAGFVAGYEYGPGLTLAPTGDALSLRVRSKLISEVVWNPFWTLPAAATLELEPVKQVPGVATFGSAADFCVNDALYDGINAGTPGAKAGCSIHPYVADFHSSMPAIDISAIGQPLAGVGARNSRGLATLGFDFPFFGVTTTQLGVSSNGFLLPVALISNWASNVALPMSSLPGTYGLIAGFWDDLQPIANRSTFTWAETTVGGLRVAVFQWEGWLTGPGTGEVSFQIQAWENGDIVYAYPELSDDPSSLGGSATVGLQGIGAGAPALPYSFDKPRLVEGQSIHYRKK